MRAARFLAILILFVAIIAAALYLLRLPLAGWAVRTAMANAGLERPQAQVTALTLNGIRLENVSARSGSQEAFRLEVVEADYDWRKLLSAREAEAVRIGPGFLRLSISEDGAVSIPGVASGGDEGGGGKLPFSSLSVSDVSLVVDAPDGTASGNVTALYDVDNGGSASAELATDGIDWRGVRITAGEASAEVEFSADGQASLIASFDGDLEAQGVIARGVNLNIDGEGTSWRDWAEGALENATGNGSIAFSAPEILFTTATLLDVMNLAPVETVFGEPLNEAALAGAFEAELTESEFVLRLAAETPLALTTPDGASFTLASTGAAPLYARNGTRETASFGFDLKSDGVSASGTADAEREGDYLRVAAPVMIEEYASPMLSLDGSMIDFLATVDGNAAEADLTVKSGLKKAQMGRLTLSDAPFSSSFRVDANLAAKTANIYNKENCVTLERGRALLAEQNAEAVLGRTQLCNSDGPLAVFTWSGDMTCSLNGELSSANGRFSLGDTSAAGRPPNIRFNAVYDPAGNRTTIDGVITGGDVTVNNAIDISSALGRFAFVLDPEMMHVDGAIEHARIEQSGEPKFITPVIANGSVRLAGAETTFDYALETPAGNALGTGAGAHDMASATGETTFTFDGLRFTPGGLQPNELAPGLKGIVSAATGGADGLVRFGWSKSGITSGAEFDLNNLAFNGPTLAITRTSGVDGSVELSNLLPITTSGLQNITLNVVDAGALKLENGEVSFEFPGDDTLHLARGEFPWFGGTIGAYDATASFNGAANIPLRAEDINLKQVLEFASVDGLSGEGVLSGSLPLVFEDGKARIENGVLRSNGPGAIRYTGPAAEAAAAAGENAQIAFDFLRDLRYKSLEVTINGALDGQLEFGLRFEGSGDLTVRNQNVRNVPVLYRINLTVENMDLVRQANLLRAIELEVQEELSGGGVN